MPLSGAEKMRRHRQRIKDDATKHAQYLDDERTRWQKRKQEGKLPTANNRSARETRYVRKVWRERYQMKKREAEKAKQESEPLPTTPTGSCSLKPLNTGSRQKMQGRRKKRKDRAAAYRRIRELEAKLEAERKRSERYRKAFGRLKLSCADGSRECGQTSDCSPRKQAKRKLLSPVKSVQKQLVFHYSLLHDLRQRIKSCRTPAEKQLAHKIFVAGTLMRKYRLMVQAKKHLGLSLKRINAKRKSTEFLPTAKSRYKNSLAEETVTTVRRFFEQDDVSRVCAGKKETVTKSKIKKQKRYLLDNMRNLHKKFVAVYPDVKISLSTFAKLRPFWVKKPRVQDRETCLCKVHENAKLLHDRLAKIGAAHGTLKETLERTVCSSYNRKCMYGACKLCRSYDRALFDAEGESEKSNCEKTFWSQWINVKETLDDGKQVRKTQKLRVEGSVEELKACFREALSDMKPHEFRVVHQFKVLHGKRNDLKANEAYLHIDFAENWTAKSLDEIQSAHFGASLRQIILHTGILYVDGQTTSFCTVSDHFSHGPCAIWSHLMPLLKKIRSEWPHVDTLHFQSDGPTTQYRNKVNFCLTATIPKMLGFAAVWWNFSEAGHGKGPADGVGAAVKRLADGFVLSGKAIQNAADLVREISLSSTMISVFHIENLEVSLPENVPTFPGTMKVHQMLARGCFIKYREFSCYCMEGDFCDCFEWKCVNYIGSHDEVDVNNAGGGGSENESDLLLLSESVLECLEEGIEMDCSGLHGDDWTQVDCLNIDFTVPVVNSHKNAIPETESHDAFDSSDIGGIVQPEIAKTPVDNSASETRDVVDSSAPIESLAASDTGSTTRSGDAADLSALHGDNEDTALTTSSSYGIFWLLIFALEVHPCFFSFICYSYDMCDTCVCWHAG